MLPSASSEPLIGAGSLQPQRQRSGFLQPQQQVDALPSASEALLTMQCCLANVNACSQESVKGYVLWQHDGEHWQGIRTRTNLTAIEKEMWIQDSLDKYKDMCSRVKLSGMACMFEDAKLNTEQLCDIITSFKAEFDQFDERTRLLFGDTTQQLLNELDRHFVDGMLNVSPARTGVSRRRRTQKDDHSFYNYSLASLDNLFGSSAIVHYESNRFEDFCQTFHSFFFVVFSILLLVITVCVCSYIMFQCLFLLIVHMSPGRDKIEDATANYTNELEPLLGFLILPALLIGLALLGCETYYVIASSVGEAQMARTSALMVALRMESKPDIWKNVEDECFWKCLRASMNEIDSWFIAWFNLHTYFWTVLFSGGYFFLKQAHSTMSVDQMKIIAVLCAMYPGFLILWQDKTIWVHLRRPWRTLRAIPQTTVKVFEKNFRGWQLVVGFVLWCILCTCVVLQPEEAYAGFVVGGVIWALVTTCTFMLADIISYKLRTKGFATLLTAVLQDRMVKPGRMYSRFHDIKRKLRQQIALRGYDYPKTEALSGGQMLCLAVRSGSDNPGGQFLYLSRFLLGMVLWSVTCIFSALPEREHGWQTFMWTCMVLIMFFMAVNSIREEHFPEMSLLEFWRHVKSNIYVCFWRTAHRNNGEEFAEEEDHDENEPLYRVIALFVWFLGVYCAPFILVYYTSYDYLQDSGWDEMAEGAIVLQCLIITLWATHCYLTDLMPDLSFDKSYHVDPLSQGDKKQGDILRGFSSEQRDRLVSTTSHRVGSGSAGKFVTRKAYEPATFNAYSVFLIFYCFLCMLFLFLSRIDVERLGMPFEGAGLAFYADPGHVQNPYSDGWEGAPNKYPVCGTTWGAESLGLRVLDFAALAQYAYSSNKSVLDTALENTFNTSYWKCPRGNTNLKRVTAKIDAFESIPRRLRVKFVSERATGEEETTYVISVKGSSNSLEFSADACIYSGIAILQFFSQFIDMFDLLPNKFLSRILKYVRIPRVANLEKGIIDKVVEMVEETKAGSKGKVKVLLTGHSLGAGIASAAGSITGTPTLVFSSPGFHFNRKVMGVKDDDAFRSVINIWPETDLVPLVDRHDETVQRIACREKGSGYRGSGDCHMISTTLCELWRVCGDYQKRNVTEYCSALLGNSEAEIEASRSVMIAEDGATRTPETIVDPSNSFLWSGWWYFFAVGALMLCLQATFRVGFGGQCNLVYNFFACLLSLCCRHRVSNRQSQRAMSA